MADDFNGNEIAIVGMAGRFPRSPDLQTFWQNLRDGVELVTFFTDEELAARKVDPALIADPSFVKAASTLEGIEEFDAAFFGFLPREATIMDPQHRLLLECSWEALEHAGYDPSRFKGPIGLYAGAAMNGYLIFHLVGNPEVASAGYVALQLANDKDYMPTRISYKLDLRGPSCLVQAACSTSLVAVHVACQSLLNHECDVALAGGVAGLVHNRTGYQHIEGGIFSPDGHCRSFDAAGRGTIFGSGVGMVVLRRLKDALEEGDSIHAIIRGSAVNNDGSLKVGYTAPSIEGQAGVITEALANAGVSADTISYVEGHGTATQLGDPIELQALARAFRASTDERRFCALGSIKSNLGHLDAAAGIAGLIKTTLALQHRQIPPSLHFQTPNPRIDWDGSPFFVNTRLSEWPSRGAPRRAGVSSFGIGGTNAHVILEEAPPPPQTDRGRPAHLLVLSARTPTALAATATRLADHLERHPALDLADVAYTLQVGRRVFGERRALVCEDREEAIRALRTQGPGEGWAARQEQQDRPVVFLFPGQGSQHVGMGRGLYEHEPQFRKHLDSCATKLRAHIGVDLREVLYPAPERAEEAGLLLQETKLAQPALFAVGYALARLWMSWGIKPRGMIGHSVGEYVAACIAGLFSLDDGLALVAARGRLASECPPGAMLSVALPPAEVQAALPASISLAAVNGPEECVVAGPTEAIAELSRHLTEVRDVRCRRLRVSHAFHSHMLDPMMGPFSELLRRVSFKAPRSAWISNVTGTWVTQAEVAAPDYWLAHLRQPVNFAAGMAELLKDERPVLLEVGPGQTLAGLTRRQEAFTERHVVLASCRHPGEPGRGPASDVVHLMETAARLWLAGVTVDWPGLHAGQRRRRVPLTTYPFERKRYWVEAVSSPWTLSGATAARRAPEMQQEHDLSAPPGAVESADGPAPRRDPEAMIEAAPAPPAGEGRGAPGDPLAVASSTPLLSLIDEQLRVMSLQLEILRRGRSGPPGSRS